MNMLNAFCLFKKTHHMPLECDSSSATMPLRSDQPLLPPPGILPSNECDQTPDIEPHTEPPQPLDEPDRAFIAEEIVEEILDSVFETLEPKSEDAPSVKEPRVGLFLSLARRICSTGESTTPTNGVHKLQTLLTLVLLVLGLALIEWLVASLTK